MKETRVLEYKETITNTFLKTVSAYANYSGGVIVFGVKDDGSVIGISDPKKSCLDIEKKLTIVLHLSRSIHWKSMIKIKQSHYLLGME